MSNKKPLALYVHIPFCVRKCLYCDFLSASATDEVQRSYIDKLKWELASAALKYDGYTVSSIFFGGGTPSVLSGESMAGLLEEIYASYDVAAGAEITLEANPASFDEAKLYAWRGAGVDRLSMGVQSLNDSELSRLGRIHSADDARRAFACARSAGFENINVDLIFGIPAQSVSSLSESLDELVAHRPEHISAYSLIVEEGTPYYERYHAADALRAKGEEQELLPSEEEEREMAALVRGKLAAAGYEQYELSNFALPGRMSRHNMVYWQRGDYAGFGLGAASCVKECRWKNTEDMAAYLGAGRIEQLCRERQYLSPGEQRSEAMFLGLRLTAGIDLAAFKARYGAEPQALYGAWIDKMLKEKMLEYKKLPAGKMLRLSERGQDVANYVMAGFV